MPRLLRGCALREGKEARSKPWVGALAQCEHALPGCWAHSRAEVRLPSCQKTNPQHAVQPRPTCPRHQQLQIIIRGDVVGEAMVSKHVVGEWDPLSRSDTPGVVTSQPVGPLRKNLRFTGPPLSRSAGGG